MKEQTLALEFLNDDQPTLSEAQRQRRAALVQKWTPFLAHPDLPEIKPEMWPMMAQLFENQVLANRQPKTLYEATVMSDVPIPNKWSLPIIRDVFPALIMNRIASIQPMPAESGGVGKVYYRHVYREDVTPNTVVTAADSDYAYNIESGVPKRLKMTITEETLTATKDILMATWSQEVAEDAAGAMGIDVEAEMVEEMAQEILRELEQRVVQEIWTGATAGDTSWKWTVDASYNSAQEYYQTLFHAFIDMNKDLKDTRHRDGDYILLGSNVQAYADKAVLYTADQRNTKSPFDGLSGVEFLGSVRGRWDVFATPYLGENEALMGIYPRSMVDTGYVFAPYIPLTPMPKHYAEALEHDNADLPGALRNTDKWTRNVRTRNAKKMVQSDMFARLTISA
jgi:hypothetical protein